MTPVGKPEVGECRACGETLLIQITEDGEVLPMGDVDECECGSPNFGRLPADEAFSRVRKAD